MFKHLGTFALLAVCLFAIAIVMVGCGPPKELPGGTALLDIYSQGTETWIPYRLSVAAEVTITIYDSDGKLVRTLELRQVPAGVYSDKDRAAYWDGRNAAGEPVASGVYFYTLTAGDFSAMQKLVYDPRQESVVEEMKEEVKEALDDYRERLKEPKKQELEEKLKKQ